MIAESLLGGVFGGLLRLAPEVINFFDRKENRKHELKLIESEIELTKAKSAVEMRRADADIEVATLDAIAVSMKEQGEMAKAGGKVIAAINALVRPAVTYWYVVLYSVVKITVLVSAYSTGASTPEMLKLAWDDNDTTIYSMILAYWFVSRSLHHMNKG